MRRVRYSVAMSLDGFIAGPNGEADWIVADPEFDFRALYAQFDTVLVGARTFEAMARVKRTRMPGMQVFVFSRRLRLEDYPGVTVVAEGAEELVARLRAEAGKDIWLFGGRALFGSLAGAGLVDTVEVAVMPVILGGGIPLAAASVGRVRLELMGHRVYKSGVIALEYACSKTAS